MNYLQKEHEGRIKTKLDTYRKAYERVAADTPDNTSYKGQDAECVQYFYKLLNTAEWVSNEKGNQADAAKYIEEAKKVGRKCLKVWANEMSATAKGDLKSTIKHCDTLIAGFEAKATEAAEALQAEKEAELAGEKKYEMECVIRSFWNRHNEGDYEGAKEKLEEALEINAFDAELAEMKEAVSDY